MSDIASTGKPQTQKSAKDAFAFVLPFITFMVIGAFYPKFSELDLEHLTTPEILNAEQIAESIATAQQKTNWYFGLIGLQVLAGVSWLVYFHRIHLNHFKFRITWLSVIVGLVGGVMWMGVCEIGIEKRFFELIGLGEWSQTRASFNPNQYIEQDSFRYLFLFLRFSVLVLIVPIVEELFLRGWFARWFVNPDFHTVALREITRAGILAIAAYGVLTHPGEAIAAALWFTLVSFLMLRTGSLWDCVVAHAITNLMLGLYVLYFSAWHLW